MTFEPPSPLPSKEPRFKGLGRYGTQNVAVCALQAAAWALLLTGVDRAPGLWKALPLLGFCAVMQGTFSMMHEAFHRNAHRTRWVNRGIGVVGATLFGTSFTLHEVNHWGHHVRNRTSAERGEFIHPGERPWAKTLLYYVATMGGLWAVGAVLPFIAWVLPYTLVRRLRAHGEFNTYLAAFEQFTPGHWWAMRAEALVLAAFWGGVFAFGPWSVGSLALAYGLFAYHWSVLQWIYHLRTPIDVVEGAYNLRIPWPFGPMWLHFNCNLTHHRRPDLPWQELPAATNWAETRPLWSMYLEMWLPPVPFPEDPDARERLLRKTYW